MDEADDGLHGGMGDNILVGGLGNTILVGGAGHRAGLQPGRG
ncbi:hypothetical protein [Methylobacterium cerastii]|nr:hypothetical protein [Methylobacterium cerastii]